LSARGRKTIDLTMALIFAAVYLYLFVRYLGFTWDYLVFSLALGGATSYVWGYRKFNRFERVGGWLWPYTTITHCAGSDRRYRGDRIHNAVSLHPGGTFAILKQLGIHPDDIRKAASERDRLSDQGALPILSSAGKGQVTQQLEIPLPPAPAEVKLRVEDIDIETVIGVNPRGKVKYRAFIVLKPRPSHLSGSDYYTTSQRRGRSELVGHLFLLNSQPLGTHYAIGFGWVRITIAVTEIVGQIPAYLIEYLHNVASLFLDVNTQILDLRMKALSTKALRDERDLYKGMYERTLKDYGDVRMEMENYKRQLIDANLPLPRQIMEHETPRIVVPPKVKKLDYRWFALIGAAGAVAYALYDVLLKQPLVRQYAFMSDAVIAFIAMAAFGAIMYIGRRKLSL